VMAHCRHPIHHYLLRHHHLYQHYHHFCHCRRVFLLLFLPATITCCTKVYTRYTRSSIPISLPTTIHLFLHPQDCFALFLSVSVGLSCTRRDRMYIYAYKMHFQELIVGPSNSYETN
jgi:hypothetical protein